MKRYLTLPIKEMKIKTTTRDHHIPVRMAVIKTRDSKHW